MIFYSVELRWKIVEKKFSIHIKLLGSAKHTLLTLHFQSVTLCCALLIFVIIRLWAYNFRLYVWLDICSQHRNWGEKTYFHLPNALISSTMLI